MNLFSFLQILDPDLLPEETKLHLAGWTGKQNPLDVFVEGWFEEWQRHQTKKNFQRKHVVSLIALPGNGRWLFAGCYDSLGENWNEKRGFYEYDLAKRPATLGFEGRLVARFERTGRQSYLRAENWAESITVGEIFAKRMRVSGFPGFNRVRISKTELDQIVTDEVDSWKAALESVGGIYVITDMATGKHYVGSATGEGGFWTRWCSYSSHGHGGNKELKALLRKEGKEYVSNFQYGILETADNRSDPEEVRTRETHWKKVLSSFVPFGYNAN